MHSGFFLYSSKDVHFENVPVKITAQRTKFKVSSVSISQQILFILCLRQAGLKKGFDRLVRLLNDKDKFF